MTCKYKLGDVVTSNDKRLFIVAKQELNKTCCGCDLFSECTDAKILNKLFNEERGCGWLIEDDCVFKEIKEGV
jgi:hypothetical protein